MQILGKLDSIETGVRQLIRNESLQQLQVQLGSALPYDLDETELSEYKNLAPR